MSEDRGDKARLPSAAATNAARGVKRLQRPPRALRGPSKVKPSHFTLKAKVAEDLERTRAGLTAERARRRTQRAEDHRRAVGDAENETDEGDALCREMLSDKEELLGDLDDFKGWPDRPVGETVARLCVELGLDPDVCVKDGDAWRVRRPSSAWQA